MCARGGAPSHLLAGERRQLGDVVGPDDEIEMADAREELLALLLRDAAGDGEDEVGVLRLERRELADLAAELLLGLLAHAARVEDDEVGLLGGLGARPAARAEHLLHAIGVVHVHLAAEGVDEIEAGQSRTRLAPESGGVMDASVTRHGHDSQRSNRLHFGSAAASTSATQTRRPYAGWW